MSWDDAVLYNDYEGMKECYAKLQEENNRFQKLVNVSKKLYPEFGKNAEYFLKLEEIRVIAKKSLEEYASITAAYWERTEALEKILALIWSAQNTDYVQKEEQE